MATAAQRVLGITELLEQILLEVRSKDGTRDTDISKCPFVLQRVNRSFAATIQNSPHLRYRMGLDYKPSGTLMNTPYSSLSVFSRPPDWGLLSIFFDFLGLYEARHWLREDSTLIVEARVLFDKGKLGFWGAKPYFDRYIFRPGADPTRVQDSWRHTRISRIKVPILLQICVEAVCWHDRSKSLEYTESMFFRAGEDNLKIVDDKVAKIERRFALHHWWLFFRAGEDNLKIVDDKVAKIERRFALHHWWLMKNEYAVKVRRRMAYSGLTIMFCLLSWWTLPESSAWLATKTWDEMSKWLPKLIFAIKLDLCLELAFKVTIGLAFPGLCNYMF